MMTRPGLISLFASTALAGGLLVSPGPARAATGTLDTGALMPQTYSSRTAAEVQNTGAGVQKGHEAVKTGLEEAASVPREAGDVASHAGRNRPTQ